MHRTARKARITGRDGEPAVTPQPAPGPQMNKRQQDKRNKNDMAQQAITLKIAGKSYSLNIESEKGGGIPSCRTGGEQLPRGDKTEQLQELDGSGLPVDGRTEIRHCKRRHAAKPRTGRRRPETSGATRRRARRLPQHPATVTEGKGQARDLPGQTVKNEVL